MRLFRSIFCLSLVVGLLGCEVQAPKDPYTMIEHIGAEPDTLNRITGTDAYEGMVNGYVYDSLAERDNKTLEWQPKIAKRWEMSEDGLSFTFFLRDDVKWHDGKPVTADHVVYTFERIQDPKVAPNSAKSYFKDAKIEKIDDYTVKFTNSIPYFKIFETFASIPIIAKHAFVFDVPAPLNASKWFVNLFNPEDFNLNPAGRAPLGNGPYKFVEWKTGKHILLERNEQYWDKQNLPAIKRILFQVVSDDTVTLQALKKSDLDMASLRPIQWVRQTNTPEFNEKFVKHDYYLPAYRYVGWNLSRPMFQDKRVRQALARLINRDAIVNKLEYGLGKLTTGPFWVLGYAYNSKLPQIPFDPAGAKKLLEEAGWTDHDNDGIRDKDGVKFQFTFLIPAGHAFYNRLATIMKKDFEAAGIEIDIQQMEWSAYLQRPDARDFDAVSLGWGGLGVDEDPYQVWHSSQIGNGGSNHVGFSNPEVDKILEEARASYDKDKRIQLFHRMHEIIYDEQPYAFLYNGPALLARDKRFENVVIYRLGPDVREWKVQVTP